MEKFGIFELLDTLSAILDDEKPTAPAQESAPTSADPSFLPPDYTGGESSAAFSSFLSKHDELARRAAKKK